MKKEAGTSLDKVLWSTTIRLKKSDSGNNVKLSDAQDYRKIAERALQCADNFYNIANPKTILSNLSLIKNGALMSNCFFSCELYLKSILLFNQISFGKKHSLSELFKLLPIDIQSDIKLRYPQIDNRNLDFDKELDDICDGFEVFRYIYERDGFAFNLMFVISFSLVLCEIAHETIK